jgi:hypothetical protein
MSDQEKILELEKQLAEIKEKYRNIQIAAFNMLNLFRLQLVQTILRSDKNLDLMAIDFSCTIATQRHDLAQHLTELGGSEFSRKAISLWERFFEVYEVMAKELKQSPVAIETRLPSERPQPKPLKS